MFFVIILNVSIAFNPVELCNGAKAEIDETADTKQKAVDAH